MEIRYDYNDLDYNDLDYNAELPKSICVQKTIDFDDDATRLYVTKVGRYANVDSHLAVHQKPLILIRLSDYSWVLPMEMSHAREIIRSVW